MVGPALPADLAEALDVFCRQPVVLVASDFDGVLAPLVDDPMTSRALDGTLEDLEALAALPRTHAAVVSGRDLAVLTHLTGLDGQSPVTRIASHGAQTSRHATGSQELSQDERALLSRLTDDLHRVLDTHPGPRLELKPTSCVLHTRGEDPDVAAAAVRHALEVAGRHPGVRVLQGKDVVEMSVVTADKGSALLALKDELGAVAVAYFGDDVTDEHVFEVLGPDDVGVKVGPGDTAAGFRLDSPEAVAAVLHAVRERRAARST
jgi:trehalose 6-phosphate phosphatase